MRTLGWFMLAFALLVLVERWNGQGFDDRNPDASHVSEDKDYVKARLGMPSGHYEFHTVVCRRIFACGTVDWTPCDHAGCRP